MESIAIVGLGSIGRRHLRLLKELRPDLRVTLVRSGMGGSCPEEALADCVVPSIEQALEHGIQAAVVSSPAPLHVAQALVVMTAGVPVLIEKPLSHELSGIAPLEDAAKRHRGAVLIGYVLRHAPAAQRFHQMLEDGRLGAPLFARIECGSYLPDWRPGQDYRTASSATPELGGGVLLELSHELDYANWFFGPFCSVQAVVGNSGTLGIEVEDRAVIALNAGDGLPVSIHLDFCRRHPARACVVEGARGSLCWDALLNTVVWHPADGEPEMFQFSSDRDAMYRTQLLHFLSCAESGDTPKVTLHDGIAALRLVEAIRASDRERREVRL